MGILVDYQLATSAPSVWAVGECAEHEGSVYGLWAPLLDQARVAGAELSGSWSAFAAPVVSTTLKEAGVSVFAGGSPAAGPGQREVAWSDEERGTYAKLVLVGNRPVGALAIGEEALGQEFGRLLRSGEMPADLLAAVTRRGPPCGRLCRDRATQGRTASGPEAAMAPSPSAAQQSSFACAGR